MPNTDDPELHYGGHVGPWPSMYQKDQQIRQQVRRAVDSFKGGDHNGLREAIEALDALLPPYITHPPQT